MQKRKITTQAEARQYAIDWQNWQSEQNEGEVKTLYYSDLAEWHEIFTDLAVRFDLKDEYLENGIL